MRLKNSINCALRALTTNRYFDSLPLADIAAVLAAHGLSAPLDGIYCGHQGRVHEPIGPDNRPWLCLTWFRMPSGRFEINAYVS